MEKALRLEDIDAVVNRSMPILPDHPFYVNFENLRDDFQERKVIRHLNVSQIDGQYRYNYQSDRYNKTFLFFAGMRGSGKTSELAKYAQKLNLPECFLVVTCNVDYELGKDRMQYMDILIFQLEKLIQRTEEVNLNVDDSILESMNRWFEDRVFEINKSLTADGNAELELGGESDNPFSVKGLIGSLLGFTAKLKMGLAGSLERATTIRTTLQNRFADFATQFNIFVEQVNAQLRKQKIAKEVLFIIDGLEKTLTADVRRAIVIGEKERLTQIHANTIFTLPIELMKEAQRIGQSLEIIMFPFIKIKERDGQIVQAAIDRFEEFVCKRIDHELFDSRETIRLAIDYSGGSPRQLLRIIEQAAMEANENVGKITQADMNRTLDLMSNAAARWLEGREYEELKKLREELAQGAPGQYGDTMQDLLEKEIVFEYNGGSYKRVNPLVERSKFYQYYVLNQS